MKSFHPYKVILFMCIMAFLFQTGCAGDSPINTMDTDTTKEGISDVSLETESNIKDQSPLLMSRKFLTKWKEETTDDGPAFQNEYAKAMAAYKSLLSGELYYTLKREYVEDIEETRITIAPNHGGKYTILDMNNDGVPELILNGIIYQVRDKTNTMYASAFASIIYTYQNGEIKEWYQNQSRADFELLSNKAIFREFERDGGIGYYYTELDSEANVGYSVAAYKSQNDHGEWEYYFDENAHPEWEYRFDKNEAKEKKIASEAQWLELLEPYFALRTDIIPWNDYSSEPMDLSTTQDNQNTEMNLTQIQEGDYSSLLGTWKEMAYADTVFDGTGLQWHPGGAGPRSSSLSVSTDKIVFDGSMILQGNTFTDYEGNSYLLEFHNDGTRLLAWPTEDSAITWSFGFYQKGTANDYVPNNGVQIDYTKNIIDIWYSGMRVLTVYGQE